MRTGYPPTFSFMDANQQDTLDLNGMINEIMCEYVQAEEEVHLKPQPEKITNVKPETQPEEEEQVVEERATKRKRTTEKEKKVACEEEKQYPRVSPLTLTGVIKGARNKNQKWLIEAKAEPAEENEAREMEAIPEDIPPAVAEEIPSGMIPLSHSYLEQAESSRRNEVSAGIMEMLKSMKKDMEKREQKWGKWQKIREEF